MNKTVKIALAGAGQWGSNVCRAIAQHPGFHLMSVCDKTEEQLNKIKSSYGNRVRYSTDFRELTDDPSIDAIALAVNTKEHFTLAMQALESGKHVFVEKPFTETVEQAMLLMDKAKEKKLVIHVDHIMIFHPAIRKIRSLIKDGYAGSLRYFDMRRTSMGGARADANVFMDLGVHDLAIIDYLSDGAVPNTVNVIGKNLNHSLCSAGFMQLEYQDFIANLSENWISPVKERKLIVGGTDRIIMYDETSDAGRLVVYDYDKVGFLDVEKEDALCNSLSHFASCIEAGKESISGPSMALRIARTLKEADEQLARQENKGIGQGSGKAVE
ncbi:MAG: Gfo/Idh/MocA family oxidoreductase [Eubacteriales bacterium]|nr:Gfo/Idh/MocA family oxidoreductase [Eubacteriales bacterium]